MPVLKVLNVGHGDSMILIPPSGCTHQNEVIFIDLGPGQHDITKHINQTDNVHIFITHHDADHLNGLKFFANTMERVREITVPFHQNEITLIAKSILSLTGIRKAKDCGEFIRLLEDILDNQVFLKGITGRMDTAPKLSFAYEGKQFCGHIECLNPPVFMETIHWLRELSLRELFVELRDVFEPGFSQSLAIYFRAMANNREVRDIDSSDIRDIMLEDVTNQERAFDTNSRNGSYVADFIIRNLGLFRQFNSTPNRENLRVLYERFIECTHDACLVMRAVFRDKSFLLTGDASKKVFNRLINKGTNLTANYLKMPHHGSIRNISKSILEAIHPDTVIISHANRRFGKASDALPNTKVLTMLEQMNVRIMLTNGICKHGLTCYRKENHLGDYFVEML